MQQAPMRYDPETGRANPLITNAAHYRDIYSNTQWCFDPWTREYRDKLRYTDYTGLTVVEPGAEPDAKHLVEVRRVADLCAYLNRCAIFARLIDVDTLLVKVKQLGDSDYWRYLRLDAAFDRAEFDAILAAAKPLVFDESEI